MITIVHGGQTGVDRGAHQGAIANAWRVEGYMPSDRRDERGPIPADVARFLVPHAAGYAERTAANVASASAALIIVRDETCPLATPGTAMTIDMAIQRNLPRKIVDPSIDPTSIARWIWHDLLATQLALPLGDFASEPVPIRLLVAGPRESKWPGACVESGTLLGRIAVALTEIRTPTLNRDLQQEQR